MEERGDSEIVFCGDKIDVREFDGPLWPYLKSKMKTHGNRTFMINPYTQEEISFNQISALSERLARGLRKIGLNQGQTLCIHAPNSQENALLNFATIAAGGIVHATNPASLAGEIRRQVLLTQAKFVVTVPDLLSTVKEALAETNILAILIGPRDGNFNYNDILALGSEDVPLPTTFGDPANSVTSLLFSSGTTGVPKGVEITQRNIRAWFYCFQKSSNRLFTEDDTALLFLPFFHIFGQVITLLTSLVLGNTVVIMEKFDMNDYLTFLAKYKVTVLFLVPPVVIGLLNHPRLSDFDLSNIRVVMCGAAPLGRETQEQFGRKFGVPILQGYGMTEQMVATTSIPQKNKVGSCGFPMAGTEMKIVDGETGKSLGINQTGDLFMRSPLTMRGYHKNPQATRETIDPAGWLITGDVGYFDSDGFLYIVDRKKELIKYKGEQVAPAVIEDILLSHPSVADSCVIGRPDPVAGELPMAFVVTKPGQQLTEGMVKDFVAKHVPSYMQLRGGVEFRRQIPKSPSGKILRRILRDELKETMKSKL